MRASGSTMTLAPRSVSTYAAPSAVAHRAAHLAEQPGEESPRLAADDVAPRDRVLALLAGDLLLRDRLRTDAGLLRPALAGLGQRSVWRERGTDRRPDDLLVEIRLAIRDRRDDERDPSGGAERAHAAVEDARRRELALDERRQIRELLREHLRRDFFATELEQQISRHRESPRRERRRREPQRAPRR
ncbi:MAG: hypothetical protein NT062_14360 [Proteobacteria bacterium]|nr:hypothetical protein [Pseudomonadota bacterium]